MGHRYANFTMDVADECSVCTMPKLPGDSIMTLACFPTHWLHVNCYNDFVKHFETADMALLCPICRSPIDKKNVTESVVGKDGAGMASASTMFNLVQNDAV